MALQTLFYVCMVSVSSAHATTDWQNGISDPAFRDCVATALETSGVSAEQLSSLKCHSKGIRRVDGLEHMPNLTTLSLFNNRLSELDVTRLAKLTMLNVARNRLKNLNVANLLSLDTLYAFQNKLTDVDLAGLNALKKIRLEQNKIAAINTADLGALESAHLFDNQMEDLDITPLKNLRFLDVKHNPMPDELYDFFDKQQGVVISHDGNADDWK